MYIIVKNKQNNTNHMVLRIDDDVVTTFGCFQKFKKSEFACIVGKKEFESKKYVFPHILNRNNQYNVSELLYISNSTRRGMLKNGDLLKVILESKNFSLLLAQRKRGQKTLVINYELDDFLILNNSVKRLLKLIKINYNINILK